MKTGKPFFWYSLSFLAFNVYTILGGAYVRATDSGAGCGDHWPLCNGKFIPQFSTIHTIIEFTHRISSGLVATGALLLFLWSFWATEKGSPVRKAAGTSLFFVFTESLLGAALVLFHLVENNSSAIRTISMSFHLVNTLLLLGALTLTAAWSSGWPIPRLSGQRKKLILCALFLTGLLAIGTTGAITALGDTLFRPDYLGENIIRDTFDGDHFLKSLRVYHPVIAISVSFVFVSFVWRFLPTKKTAPRLYCLSLIAIPLFVTQCLAGFINIVLLTPTWMQLVHLFFGDLTWLVSVLFVNEVLAAPQWQNPPVVK